MQINISALEMQGIWFDGEVEMERMDGLPAGGQDGTREGDEWVEVVEREGVMGVEYGSGFAITGKSNIVNTSFIPCVWWDCFDIQLPTCKQQWQKASMCSVKCPTLSWVLYIRRPIRKTLVVSASSEW